MLIPSCFSPVQEILGRTNSWSNDDNDFDLPLRSAPSVKPRRFKFCLSTGKRAVTKIGGTVAREALCPASQIVLKEAPLTSQAEAAGGDVHDLSALESALQLGLQPPGLKDETQLEQAEEGEPSTPRGPAKAFLEEMEAEAP